MSFMRLLRRDHRLVMRSRVLLSIAGTLTDTLETRDWLPACGFIFTGWKPMPLMAGRDMPGRQWLSSKLPVPREACLAQEPVWDR